MWKDLKRLWQSDNLLEQAWEQSYEMLDIDREMFLETIRILRETDKTALYFKLPQFFIPFIISVSDNTRGNFFSFRGLYSFPYLRHLLCISFKYNLHAFMNCS